MRLLCKMLSSSLTPAWQMNIYKCLHVCSLTCDSHVQPSFQSLVHAARDALQKLFSPLENLLDCIQEMPPTYPTRDQLFLSRVVGLTQFKLYFSYLLLSRDMKTKVNSAICDRLATPSRCLFTLPSTASYLVQVCQMHAFNWLGRPKQS